ncbi:Ternary complex factor MIP1, leucine-zipper [Quillaja saponaria]|uniref:Ternary complex factor MIP1, leucine-zipper n=1 Tax=Quillaja saponaria TaxID=32244 RepID=A0AAD7PEN3_QUISA|nr:Ternary complex factor MIP1, leucine-zipper [Quillaja saponaria]
MCDLPVGRSALSQSDSLCKSSCSATSYCDLEVQLYIVDGGNSPILMSNLTEETRSTEPRIERNNANPCRFQLEQDVQQLQQKLSDEMELNAFLDHIVEKNATSFSNPSYLPYHYASKMVLLSRHPCCCCYCRQQTPCCATAASSMQADTHAVAIAGSKNPIVLLLQATNLVVVVLLQVACKQHGAV